MNEKRHISQTTNLQGAEPFASAEEAWFWFMVAQAAKNDGARITAGQGAVTRPCEPSDIFQALNRLYRQRRLRMDHIRVLKHYGERHMAPDPRRPKELRAYLIWNEALARLEAVLEAKGIVRKAAWFNPQAAANWIHDVMIYEQMEA